MKGTEQDDFDLNIFVVRNAIDAYFIQYFKYLKGQRAIEVKPSEIALPYFFELKKQLYDNAIE